MRGIFKCINLREFQGLSKSKRAVFFRRIFLPGIPFPYIGKLREKFLLNESFIPIALCIGIFGTSIYMYVSIVGI